ncbi:adenosine deaminase 2 isoform X2 [Drosophila takahashii]|uniref:adenosine deaminase 2 isoform X2 n=1 Tax=Drosophila takahashii TaxID=29030 RepID=UPI003898EEA6
MAVLLGRRSPIAGWAKRAMPTAAQFLHENPNEMTLLEMLGSTNLRKSSPEDYRVLRDIVNTFERYSGVGNDIQLTLAEHSANELIMGEKKREYEKGIMDPSKFAPGHHIFQVLHTVKKSPLFQMLRKMPKGAALKTHDTSMCSSRAVIEMTYRENLWVCTTHKGCRVEEFRFAAEKPKDMRHKDGEWQPMEKLRELRGEENLRKYLRVRLSMYPLSSFRTNAHAWDHMMGIFTLLDGLLQYAPLWGDYYYRALEEFYADGVQYLEVRTVVPQLYCLDGSRLPQRETVQIYLDTLERFKKEHPGFIDSKLIYAPLRHVQPEVVGQYVKQCTELNANNCFLISENSRLLWLETIKLLALFRTPKPLSKINLHIVINPRTKQGAYFSADNKLGQIVKEHFVTKNNQSI